MAFDKATLDRWYQGLNQTHVNLKKHFDTLNRGGPLPVIQAEITNLGRTITALGTMIDQFKTQIQATPNTPAATPGGPMAPAAPTPTSGGPMAPAATASLKNLISFADYLDYNGFGTLSDKVTDVLKLSAQTQKFDLTKLADYLDNNEFYALADKVDEVRDLFCMAEDYGFVPKSKVINENEADDDSMVQPRSEGSLSTRYCPDHRGTQAIRIDENTYQCPIDGKKYNYEMGYVNYEGQQVPGGSIANQTPGTSDYGGISMRLYDTRSDILNKMN